MTLIIVLVQLLLMSFHIILLIALISLLLASPANLFQVFLLHDTSILEHRVREGQYQCKTVCIDTDLPLPCVSKTICPFHFLNKTDFSELIMLF